MQVSRFAALAATAVVFTACGGADRRAEDTVPANDAAAQTTTQPPAGPATAAAITGTIHEVRMLGDEQGYRYDPVNITVRPGDGIRFINVSGWPHNVAFDVASVPANGRAQLTANMPDQISELSSRMFVEPNETYTISFGNVPAGRYPYHCTPHLAMGMRGEITVQ